MSRAEASFFLPLPIVPLLAVQLPAEGAKMTEVSKTLGSDTGSNQQGLVYECSLDYLQGTAVFPNPQRFHEFLDYVFDSFSDNYSLSPGRGVQVGKSWTSSGVSIRGGKIAYSREQNGTVCAWVSLPGKCWHQLSARDQWRLCLGLQNTYRFKPTRIDFKVRDYTRMRMPSELVAYAQLGQVRGIRRYESSGNGLVGSDMRITAYLGSRKSQKFLRVYDALPIHGENAIDWELQLRDEHAMSAFAEFVSIPSEVEQTENVSELICLCIGGFVIGAVDFVEQSNGRQRNRCSMQTWWKDFKSAFGMGMRIALPRRTPGIQETLNWIDRQVIVMLATLADGMGLKPFREYLWERVCQARSRYQPRHLGLIEQMRVYAAELRQ
jgi:hypothetical protein